MPPGMKISMAQMRKKMLSIASHIDEDVKVVTNL
jgi:hypothetical protein